MSTHRVDFAELQAEEFYRYKTLEQVYQFKTRNPAGMRFTNLQRVCNVIAASKMVGWPATIDVNQLLASAGENIQDYLSGPYLATLPEYRQSEFAEAQTAETWFDFVQLGLYVALYAGQTQTIKTLSEWVKFDMTYDSGIAEVSRAVNVLYEQLCALLRGEPLSTDFMQRFEDGTRRKRELPLAAMIVALAHKDVHTFKGSLDQVIAGQRGKSNDPTDVLALDATNLCNAWILLVGPDLGAYRDIPCLHIRD